MGERTIEEIEMMGNADLSHTTSSSAAIAVVVDIVLVESTVAVDRDGGGTPVVVVGTGKQTCSPNY